MSVGRMLGPFPSRQFHRQVSHVVSPPMVGMVSGEFAADKPGLPLGVVRHPGLIYSVELAVQSAGKNDTQVPTFTADLKVNGVSCLTTKPSIAHVSGEIAQQKTTYDSAADTGITKAVLDQTKVTLKAGDVLTWDALYTGNGSPTTKMKTPSLIVTVDPTGPKF